jgi:hypothetical protein
MTGRWRITPVRYSRACLSTCGGAHVGVTGGREIRSAPSRAAAGRACPSARRGTLCCRASAWVPSSTVTGDGTGGREACRGGCVGEMRQRDTHSWECGGRAEAHEAVRGVRARPVRVGDRSGARRCSRRRPTPSLPRRRNGTIRRIGCSASTLGCSASTVARSCAADVVVEKRRPDTSQRNDTCAAQRQIGCHMLHVAQCLLRCTIYNSCCTLKSVGRLHRRRP